ncbi:hypothetical protein SAMN05443245_5018 [Paraburkholderia fungorum]|uniref:Uncharacterized protein n=1 Tax=Paraburkholderia fungorum TaxID=134537 RepID=A0A1H1ID75_9BURK|nr:hypothetical protein SAMN05443245_5018 [Paraburkholderia fungorum]
MGGGSSSTMRISNGFSCTGMDCVVAIQRPMSTSTASHTSKPALIPSARRNCGALSSRVEKDARLLTMHRDQKPLRTGTPRRKHGLNDSTVPRCVIGSDHHDTIRLQQPLYR